MLKTILLSACCLLFSYSSYAKIWRVNNNNGITANFTTLQAAHDGAASGDTLHLEGSPNSYGNLTANKKLVIIGPGFFLDLNPNLQVFSQTAKVDNIRFNEGAEGSVVMGLEMSDRELAIFCNDIAVRRNRFSYTYQTTLDYYTGSINLYYKSSNSSIPVSSIVISQNYGCRIDINYASTAILITNNYIGYSGSSSDATTGTALEMHENAVAIIQNNIFRRGKIVAYNSSVTNNILYAGTFEGARNLVSNNIGYGTQFGTSNGNKSNVVMSTVFDATGTSDAYWKLKSGSPAIGAGYGSTTQNPVDCGIFGGNTPYVLSGIPPVPAIYAFTNQPVGSTNDPIDVTIKVRSNN
ncbi:hypothetical protein GO755_20505 [Spirosoma sp. HMF4905]|uniref:Right-handed parallel beta-helix repeat-containing protein n=1 Tax=Spirosoma arboris TaxID=2682092 RepID=A0A7K1SFF5_9BACT|nr:hypothetical protein [Spirosoma arboris]MVM32438.1 hypothetical protein [Spirosoma arboris]